jgi:hypothetical protein
MLVSSLYYSLTSSNVYTSSYRKTVLLNESIISEETFFKILKRTFYVPLYSNSTGNNFVFFEVLISLA